MFHAEKHHETVETGGSVAVIIKFTGASSVNDRKLTITYRERRGGDLKTWTSAVP